MYKNIVVPVSFDENRNAAGAIEVAQALRADGGKVTLLHVIETLPSYTDAYFPQDYLSERSKTLAAQLKEIADGHPDTSSAVINGHSGRTITEWAESNDADCVVIASHRPGMQDLLIGSTASFVVRHANCAVHVLR